MADFVYNRDPQRFYFLGMDLNRPADALKPLHAASTKNVRMHQTGRIETRQGMQVIDSTYGSYTHSIRRLNNPLDASYARILGDGTSVYYGTDSGFTPIDSGYSGDPLALIPYRPEQSPYSWMFIGDSSRMRKVNTSGAVHQLGLPYSNDEPVATLGAPYYKVIDDCEATTGWSNTAALGAPSVSAIFNTTITAVLYDSGTTGWCCVAPAAATYIGPGCRIIADSGGINETITVKTSHPGSTATIISSITYDSGSTGSCSIQLRDSYSDITLDAMLYNSTVAEYSRVTAVIPGPAGTTCVLCSTASTWSAADAVTVVASFRTYSSGTLAAAMTLTGNALHSTYAITIAQGTSYLQKDIHTTPIDLTILAAGVPVQPDDYIHLSIYLQHPMRLIEGRIMFDIGNSATFAKDYYYGVFTPADLSPTLADETVQKALKDAQANWIPLIPGADVLEIMRRPQAGSTLINLLKLGQGWFDLFIKFSDLIRVGQDPSASLKAVYYLRLYLNMDISPATTDCAFDSIAIGGGFGPDSGIGAPYMYRYRARCSTTGAVSAWGPANRDGTFSRRTAISISIPSQYTLAAEADVIDFSRFGGTLDTWHYVGTVLNSASPVTFVDNQSDDVIVNNEGITQTNHQLWPLLGTPISGTTSKVSGVLVTLGAAVSTVLAPGTGININGVDYNIYRQLSSTLIELQQNAGAQTAVVWRMPEPVYMSRPLPCLWGPLDDTLFACGDLYNPQRLYFTHPNMESAAETNYIDITSPSEPLQNGVIYNGRAYVWSTDRMFQIVKGNEPDKHPWDFLEIPNGMGLFTRWAITIPPGPYVGFLGRNGVYLTDGGTPRNITNDTLYPLFPHEGNPGERMDSTVAVPDMRKVNAPLLRLAYYSDFMYFDYPPVVS